ncbi:MAG TPA: hypothetical protein VL287_04750 [Gemmatimonadales bacterium]|nr:hypothetical protein [Gemmatimonadales bacterium]
MRLRNASDEEQAVRVRLSETGVMHAAVIARRRDVGVKRGETGSVSGEGNERRPENAVKLQETPVGVRDSRVMGGESDATL